MSNRKNNLENSEDVALVDLSYDELCDLFNSKEFYDFAKSFVELLPDTFKIEETTEDKDKETLYPNFSENEETCKNQNTCECDKNLFCDKFKECREQNIDFEDNKIYKELEKSDYTNKLGNRVYCVKYKGISEEFINSYNFFKWINKVYADVFKHIYIVNDFECCYDDCNFISEIEFYFSSDSAPNINLAITPWYWDDKMRSFYFLDDEGNSNYIRFNINEDKVEVVMKDNSIVTDVISKEDRENFINIMNHISDDFKNTKCDKMSKNDEKCDKVSCSDNKNDCGTHFDNHAKEIKNAKSKMNNIADIVNSYDDCLTISNSKSDKRDYSYTIKRIYKDILYKKSNGKKTEHFVLELFDYMLTQNIFNYIEIDNKIVLSISCKEMEDNIDSFNKEKNKKYELPFMILKGIDWENLDVDFITNEIQKSYGFDEVNFILNKNSIWKEDSNYYFICSFLAM